MLGGLKRRNTGAAASHKTYGALLPSQLNPSIDGSGRSVSMEAPILKSVKRSSLYTRLSYGWCLTSVWLAWFSWRWIRYEYGTINISCDTDDCKLNIIPYHTIGKSYRIAFHRSQLGPAASVLVNKDGDILYQSQGQEGTFDSYTMTLDPMGYQEEEEGNGEEEEEELTRMEERMKEKALVTDDQIRNMEMFGSAAMTDPDLVKQQVEAQRRKDRDLEKKTAKSSKKKTATTPHRSYDYSPKLPSLDGLQDIIHPNGMGQYTFVVRKYNIGHTKRRVASFVNRINSYRLGNRQRLSIRENTNVIWQGIMGVVLGIFSFLLSLLLGQFSEPKTGGYGTRGSSRRKVEQSNNRFSSRNVTSPNPISIPSSRSGTSYSSTSYSNRSKAYGGYSGGYKGGY